LRVVLGYINVRCLKILNHFNSVVTDCFIKIVTKKVFLIAFSYFFIKQSGKSLLVKKNNLYL